MVSHLVKVVSMMPATFSEIISISHLLAFSNPAFSITRQSSV